MTEQLHPWRRLRSLPGVRVIVTRLHCGRWGFYDPDSNTIYIDSRLTQGERRSTMTHELLHLERGDKPCSSDWHEAKQERLVDGLAARDLIPLDALADTLAWAADEHEAADALWTDVTTVRTRIERLTPAEHRYIEDRMEAKGEVA